MDVKTTCLGALTLGPASGYEIRKMFEEGPFAHFHEASYGSIYPALSKLLSEGLATVNVETQAGRPEKKIYEITPEGRRVFAHALTKTPDRDRIRSEALFMLFFANFLDHQHMEEVYDGYLATFRALTDKLENLDCTDVSQGRRLVRGLGQATYGAALKYLDDNREAFLAEMAGRPINDDTPPKSAAGGDK